MGFNKVHDMLESQFEGPQKHTLWHVWEASCFAERNSGMVRGWNGRESEFSPPPLLARVRAGWMQAVVRIRGYRRSLSVFRDSMTLRPGV